jgi:hydrogenase nickel incorporation protein HypB
MCEECGCGIVDKFQTQPMQAPPKKPVRLREPKAARPAQEHQQGHEHHAHAHGHEHAHEHEHEHGDEHQHHHEHRTISVLESLLADNDRLAERNRGFLRAKGIVAINLISSPGSGKTLLLEKTLERLQKDPACRAAVIVGDLQTANDATRIRKAGAPAVQITTGAVCHLDADMVASGIEQLELDGVRLLFIENVGNLVCPTAFDLGEDCRVVLVSTTEGEDKPLKYAPMFHTAHLVVISKMDLAEPAEFDLETARQNIRRSAPQAHILELSAKTGLGMDEWIAFLREKLHGR